MAEERFEYLYSLVLGESIVIEIAFLVVIFINVRTLYKIKTELLKRKIILSPMLLIYIYLWILVAIVTLVNNTFVIIYWHPTVCFSDIESPMAFLYISGAVYLSLMPLPAVASLFSTIERCLILVIHNPSKLKRIQKLLIFMDIFVKMCVAAIILEAFISSSPVPLEGKTKNISPTALSRDDAAGMRFKETRITLAIINIFATIFLIYFLRKSKLENSIQKAFGNLVKHVLLVQTFSDLFVHGFAYLCEMFTHIPASAMFGAYARLFCALDGIFCCLLFARSIRNLCRKNGDNMIKLTTSVREAAVPHI